MPFLLLILFAAPRLFAQTQGCASTPAWSVCEMGFDLTAGENPESLELRAEFRSPHHRTYPLIAFRDSGTRFIIRFTPTEAGDWEYRLSSNLPRLDGQQGRISASPSDAAGFVHPATNLHHFQTENGQPHLWMAAALDHFVRIPRADFDKHAKFSARVNVTGDHPIAADFHPRVPRANHVNCTRRG